MSEILISPVEKKLKNLKQILWIVFASIAIVTLLCGGLSVPVLFIAQNDPSFGPPPVSIGFLIATLVVSLVVFIGGVGVICVLIYLITKNRLEKDEDMFL